MCKASRSLTLGPCNRREMCSSKLKAVCRGMQKDQPSDRQMIAFAGCSTPSVATAAGNSPGLAADQSPVSPQGERWRATPPLLQATLSHSHSHFNMDPGAWAQVSQQHRYGTNLSFPFFIPPTPHTPPQKTLHQTAVRVGISDAGCVICALICFRCCRDTWVPQEYKAPSSLVSGAARDGVVFNSALC